MKSFFVLVCSLFLGLSVNASAHDGCAHGKKDSCCSAKAGKSCCSDKKAHHGHCRARSVLGFNGLGYPVRLRSAGAKACCKSHGAAKDCCARPKAGKCCDAKATRSACPVVRAMARGKRKADCCSH